MEDPNFDFQVCHSTACICCSDRRGNNGWTTWIDFKNIKFFLIQKSIICSSSQGLLLYYHPSSPDYPISFYSIDNPFIVRPPSHPTIIVPPQPLPLLRDTTDAVLIPLVNPLGPNRFYCIVRIFPDPTPYHGYSYDMYMSGLPEWITESRRFILRNEPGRIIVPNSGVPCGRWAYWLSLGPNRLTAGAYVVRFDFMSITDPRRYRDITYYDMPPNQLRGYDAGMMKLGTVWNNTLGLVVANKRRSRIELYTMDLTSINGNEFMSGWRLFKPFLKVSETEGMEEDAVDITADKQGIMCREMPRPIKFQSARMEVFLLVGGRRMLRWENSWSDPELTRVVDCGLVKGLVPSYNLADHGVPLVITNILPSQFGGF